MSPSVQCSKSSLMGGWSWRQRQPEAILICVPTSLLPTVKTMDVFKKNKNSQEPLWDVASAVSEQENNDA